MTFQTSWYKNKIVFRVNPKSTLFQRWIWSMNQHWQIDVEYTWISRWPKSRRYFNIYQRWNNVGCLLGYFSKLRFSDIRQYAFKDTLKTFDDFKNKRKIVWKCIQYTMHCDKIQILKKSPSDEINCTKMPFSFSRATTHHSFTFNLRFLYELKD